MRDFAKAFYADSAWKKTRAQYAASVGGLCEDCLSRGIVTPGEIVHHKITLSPDNINDPDVTLNWDNLELLCRDCHAKAHGSKRRYKADEMGHITAR